MRELEFKAKLDVNFIYNGMNPNMWVSGNYIKQWEDKLNSYIDIIEDYSLEGKFLINPQTLCQLITSVNCNRDYSEYYKESVKLKIFEYDCFFKKTPSLTDNTLIGQIFFYQYSTDGSLYSTTYIVYKNDNGELNFKYDITKMLQTPLGDSNNPFDWCEWVGNWHDGEDYLLKRIKEVENEK
jgi:hypothetical protein